MTTGITPKGFKEAVQKLRTLEDIQALAPTIKAGALHAKRYLAKYPPSPSGPGPYPARWYIRGRGPAWALKGGGYHSRKTSETLGRKWSVTTKHGGLTALLVNNASYARWVQDRDVQARVHQKTGWPTVQSVAEEQGPVIVMRILAKIRKIMEGR